MGKKIYLRGDGNGGINISLPVATVVLIIGLLLSALPFILATGSMKEKILNNEAMNKDLAKKYTADISEIKSQISSIKETIGVLETTNKNNKELLVDLKEDLIRLENKIDRLKP